MINEQRYFMIISMPLKSLQASKNKGHYDEVPNVWLKQ